MKITRRQLRRIIREALDSPLKAEKYAFNKMLTKVLQDINEESIPFGNDKEVVAAIDAVEAAFMRLKKAVFNSHAGQQLREHMTDRASLTFDGNHAIHDYIDGIENELHKEFPVHFHEQAMSRIRSVIEEEYIKAAEKEQSVNLRHSDIT